MPSAVPSSGSFTFQPWTCSRYSSTGHHLNITHGDERMAAMLHGKKRNRGEEVASKRTPLEHVPLQPSRHGARGSAQSEKPRKKNHWEGRGSTRKKREKIAAEKKGVTTAFLGKSTAGRQRSNAPELKDEAYIRRTMRMPTPQDYPSLPQNVFKTPRSSIRNVAHGAQLAECRSEFVELARNVYQCTVYYKSAMHNEAVVGEGRTEASRSTL